MMGSWVVNATGSSNIMSSLSSHVGRSHTGARSLVVGIGSHSGVVVVRHCGFYIMKWSAPTLTQKVDHERCENTGRWVAQRDQTAFNHEAIELGEAELCCSNHAKLEIAMFRD